MSELAATLREAIANLAASDRSFQRFGAAHHRYALAPPLTAAALAAVETRLGAPLPDDVRDLATALAAGGAGPYHGWLQLERAADFVCDAPAGVTAWQRALPIAHLGCGYAALLPLDGAATGSIWIDARALGVVSPIYASFAAYYIDWIERLSRNALPEAFVPPAACALANALGGFLGVCERRLGLDAGTISGPALREAFSQLGPGAIELAAESALPLFAAGDRVDPCIACATLLANLGSDGLRRDVVAPGALPLPLR